MWILYNGTMKLDGVEHPIDPDFKERYEEMLANESENVDNTEDEKE